MATITEALPLDTAIRAMRERTRTAEGGHVGTCDIASILEKSLEAASRGHDKSDWSDDGVVSFFISLTGDNGAMQIWGVFMLTSNIYYHHSALGRKKKSTRKVSKRQYSYRIHFLKYFGFHETTSNAAICFAISEKLGWQMPTKASRYKAYMRKAKKFLDGKKTHPRKLVSSEEFYGSKVWKETRYIVLQKAEGKCHLCGARASDGVQLHVDHIIPRSKAPNKELDFDNLQVLCEDCNFGKSNIDDTDWKQHWESL